MKLFTFFLLFSSSIFSNEWKVLQNESREILGLIKKARACSVKKIKGGVLFCSGLRLREGDLTDLRSLNYKSCLRRVQKLGFKLSLGPGYKDFPLQEKKDFLNSTKRAQVYYDLKLVAFKKESDRDDCLHELLHLYQQARFSLNPLSPKKRNKRKEKIILALEEKIEKVVALEKRNKKKEASILSAKLQVFINLIQEWRKLGDWLDEKEIYELFARFPRILDIGPLGVDIAVSNLIRLKDFLSWRSLIWTKKKAQQLLAQKYKKETPFKNFVKSKKIYEKKKKSFLLGFKKGLISRKAFEKKVIALNKGWSLKKLKEGPSINEYFKWRGKLFQFDEVQDIAHPKKITLPLKKKSGLWYVNSSFGELIVDLGSMDSVLTPRVYASMKRSDVSLIGSVLSRTVEGAELFAPRLQWKRAIKVGGNEILGMSFIVRELDKRLGAGLLGLSFFSQGEWEIDFKNKVIHKKKFKKDSKRFSLQSDFDGRVEALEFTCPKGEVLRLDSGSVIFADLGQFHMSSKKFFEIKRKGLLNCGHLKVQGSFETSIQNEVLFDRGVSLNLGLPFMEQFQSISFSLNRRLVQFKEYSN